MEVSGTGKVWNDWRFFFWIYQVWDAAARANWLHSLIQKASINISRSGFFDILIDCLNIGISSWSS